MKLTETLKEILEQVTEFRSDYLTNEQAVRTQLIEPVLNSLGWRTSNPKFVRPNAPNEEGKIPDYTLLKDSKSKLVVEAKNLSVELVDDKVINQIANYCYKPGIEFGILTNGVRWLLFNTFQKNPQDRIVWQVDLEKENIDAVSRKLSSFSYDNIDRLESLIHASKTLESNWSNLITSTDSIVSIVAQKLIDKIRSQNPNFQIDSREISTFTKNKLSELFEITNDQDDDDDAGIDIVPIPANTKEKEFIEVKEYIFNRRQKTKIREKISVTFPDGAKVSHHKVADTFVETISKIGADRVKTLGIVDSGVPLIAQNKDNKYTQHKLGSYWIMVGTSTNKKFEMLNEINSRLNLNLKIEKFVP